jgi:hypothetical protein
VLLREVHLGSLDQNYVISSLGIRLRIKHILDLCSPLERDVMREDDSPSSIEKKQKNAEKI